MRNMIVTLSILLMAASAQAQGAVWSATFTPGTDGYSVGCRNGGGYAECSDALKDDTFTVGEIVYTVTELYLTQGGTNRIYFAGTRTPANGTPWVDIADALTIGSTSLDIVYAFKAGPTNTRANWRLRWTGDRYPGSEDLVSLPDDGTSISVKLISGEVAEPDPEPDPEPEPDPDPEPEPDPALDTFEYWDTDGNGDLTCAEAFRAGVGPGLRLPAYDDDRDGTGVIYDWLVRETTSDTDSDGVACESINNGYGYVPNAERDVEPVPPSPPLTCDEGEEVVGGVCVPVSPPPLTCGEGEEVENGVCVPVSPPPLTCGEGEEVENGVCVPVPPPPLTCGEGEEVENGVCVPIQPPPPLTCEEGEEVVDGVCVPIQPPPPLTCEEGEEVVDGVCVPVPPPPLTCDSDPNADNMLSINERFDMPQGTGRPCAVSVDGKIRALLLSEGGAIAIQSDLDSEIHPSIEMRKGDQTIQGVTAVF